MFLLGERRQQRGMPHEAGDRGHVSTSAFGKEPGLVAYACSRAGFV
jgi:hypothetical protein